jgi:hypothetical protein
MRPADAYARDVLSNAWSPGRIRRSVKLGGCGLQRSLLGFDYNLWIGMYAPAGTPQESVDKINADVAKIMATPEFKERLAALGAETMVMTPAEFRRFMRDEMQDSAKVVKAANIRIR